MIIGQVEPNRLTGLSHAERLVEQLPRLIQAFADAQ